MKFFWRLKRDEASEPAPNPDKPVAETAAGAEAPAAEVSTAATSPDAKAEAVNAEPAAAEVIEVKDEPASNVVTLQPSRLTERIAAAALKTVNSLTSAEPVSLVTETLKARAPGPLPGQEPAYQHLSRALAAANPQAHVLVAGRAGSGRRTAVLETLEHARARLPRPCDWVYLASGDGRRLEAFSLPHGQGAMLAREANAAVARIRANYERLAASDDFRLGLEIIDEESRQRAGKTLDLLKRRAEEQNIALVKTPEGFVLAPMHEGKVVRNDVFRALPETMQREVEIKITELEAELKAFLERLPAEDNAQSDRIAAFHRDAAVRVVKPHIDTIRVAFTDCGAILDGLHAVLVSGIANEAQASGGKISQVFEAQIMEAQTAADFSEKAPAIFAHEVSHAALYGEVGRDSAGRLILKPGALMHANGGYLVLEAWRLAADPRAWAALAAALEMGQIRPTGCGGSAADPLPFAGRVILIADEHALARLLAVDSGLRRYFPHIVRLPSSLPRSSMGVAEYASFAAGLAAAQGLRPIAATASDALYRAALSRDGDASTVPLDAHALRTLLLAADLEAEAEDSAHIRSNHIEEAARRGSDVVC